jgi:DHA2 family multidrug resistance protein
VFDPTYLRRKAASIDYWGIGLLVLGMASLQIMLDKGQEEDWFSSHFIGTLAVLAVVGLGGLIIRELTTANPIIDLSVFKYRSYAIGTFLMTVVGFVLYGSTVLLPLLMQELLGYTATHAGVTNFPRGFASFLAMPFIGILTNKVDTRKLLFSGVVLSAGAMFLLSRLSLDVGFWNFWWPLMLQGAALGLIFVPLTTVTHDPIPRERLGNATSIFNVMRNIGASIGISIVETLQYRALQKHINTLGKFVSPSNLKAQTMIAGLKQNFISQGADPATATKRAYDAVWGMLNQQAAMLSYNDVFFILSIIFLMMAPLVLLMRKPKRGGAVMAH